MHHRWLRPLSVVLVLSMLVQLLALPAPAALAAHAEPEYGTPPTVDAASLALPPATHPASAFVPGQSGRPAAQAQPDGRRRGPASADPLAALPAFVQSQLGGGPPGSAPRTQMPALLQGDAGEREGAEAPTPMATGSPTPAPTQAPVAAPSGMIITIYLPLVRGAGAPGRAPDASPAPTVTTATPGSDSGAPGGVTTTTTTATVVPSESGSPGGVTTATAVPPAVAPTVTTVIPTPLTTAPGAAPTAVLPSGDAPEAGAPTTAPSTTAPPSSGTATTIMVSPDQGGTLRFPDGRVQVDIPAGAVTTPVTITLRRLPEQAAPGFTGAGLFFDLTAQDAQGQPVTQFLRDLHFTLRYAAAPELDANQLQFFYSRDGGPWTPIPSQVDPATQQVTAAVDHFTRFALMAASTFSAPGVPSYPVGTTLALCAGTELWASPADIWHNTGTPFIAPENNYDVLLINPNNNSPYDIAGVVWLNTSRKAVTGAAGDGTGWVSVDQAAAACQANDPTGATLDFLAWLKAMRPIWRQFGYRPYTVHDGDPVNTSTGNFVYQHTDVQVPGVAGFDLLLQRVYNSLDTRERSFGLGWSSLLDTAVTVAPDGSVDVRYPDGHGAYFEPGGAGYVPGDPGVFDTLTQDGAGFTLTTPDQITYTFNAKGYLVTLSERHGNTITFDRDDQGHATSITDSAGRVFTLSYAGDHVEAISDPAGRSWRYTYTGTMLETFTDARGGTWRYTYAAERLSELADPEGITFLKNTYDGEGRVVEQLDAAGSQSSFTYDGDQTVFHDNLGNVTTYTFDERKRTIEQTDALGQVEQFTYAEDDTRIAYTDKNGQIWRSTYDDRGNLLSTTDPLGHAVSFTYNGTNDLTSMTDQGGPGDRAHTTTYGRNGAGDLTRIAQPDGTTITADYDGRGQLRTYTDANGHTTSLSYDDQGNLVSVTDPLGQTARYVADAVGRRVRATDANGHATQLAYDGNTNLTSLTDPRGGQMRFAYDGNDNLITLTDRRGGVTTYAYDVNLKLIAETDPEGHTTRYAYDAMYNRVRMTDPRGNSTQYRYDAIYRLTEVEDALGGVSRLAYDPNGNVTGVTNALGHTTAFRYDAVNRMVQQTDALNGVTALAYDAVNRPVQQTNPRGAVTRVAYDLLDRPIRITDALDGVQTLAYDAVGNLIRLTDANGHTTTLTYDSADRLVTRTDPEGHVTTIGYDAVGNTTVITDALGRVTRAAYDPNDNLVQVTDALDGVTRLAYDAEDTLVARTDANQHTTRFAYDLDGLLVTLTEAGGQVSTFAYDAAHNLVTFTNAKGNAWTSAYDALNRPISATDPLSHTTRYTYDAISRLSAVTDANTIVTGYHYDPLDRLIAVVQNERPGLTSDVQTNVTTGYAYDPVGNLITLTDANGHATHFRYDLLDRLTEEVNPLDHTWQYTYDPVGNLTKRTDANGTLTTYAYDADDLLTHIGYPDGSGVSFAYDAVHNQTAMTDTLGLTRNAYDALNRLTASTNHVGQQVGYAYDPVGNRIAMTYPDGRTVRYAYDPTDFAIQITDPDGFVFDVTRDPIHNVVRVQNPNQTLVERDIDAAERLTAVRNLTSQNPHETISSFAYTLDPVGNRTRVESVFGWRKPESLNYAYTYDPLYRLVRSDDSVGHFTRYGYDAVGNRVFHQTNDDPTLWREIDTVTTTASYDAANALITAVRAVAPRGKADRALQAAQALRAFAHEVAAQRGKHITTETADSLLTQANARISDLEGDKPANEATTATALADLRTAVETARSAGQIDGDGTANSLLVKLGHAEEANARRGPELHTTLYDYDANGNRVRRTAPDEGSATDKDWLKTDYTYDFENRLVHVQDFHTPGVPGNGTWLPMDETMVQFDGYGRVFRRQHDQHIAGGGDQEWVDYVYDGLDPIAEYRNPSPQYTNYYRGLGHILSQHDFKSQQSPVGTLSYYHYDGLDSVTGITKHIGQSVHTYRYHDYGIMLDINGKAPDASNFTDPHNHYTYTGQEWDEHLDIYHFYARDYEPATGVWLQQDPYRGRLAEPKTLHRYGYVGGNPATYRDWLGFVASGTPYPTPVPTPTQPEPISINANVRSPQDVTKWYFEQENKVLQEIEQRKSGKNFKWLDGFGTFGQTVKKVAGQFDAASYFIKDIRPGGSWDYKENTFSHIDRNQKRSLVINGEVMDTAGPANILFGRGLKALGWFSEEAVTQVSGAFQLKKSIDFIELYPDGIRVNPFKIYGSVYETYQSYLNFRDHGNLDYTDDLRQVRLGYRGTLRSIRNRSRTDLKTGNLRCEGGVN